MVTFGNHRLHQGGNSEVQRLGLRLNDTSEAMMMPSMIRQKRDSTITISKGYIVPRKSIARLNLFIMSKL